MLAYFLGRIFHHPEWSLTSAGFVIPITTKYNVNI